MQVTVTPLSGSRRLQERSDIPTRYTSGNNAYQISLIHFIEQMPEQTVAAVAHDEFDHSNDEQGTCRELLILYATETGNAQDCADYIARQCRRVGFRGRVLNVDAYSPVRFNHSLRDRKC